MSKALSFRDLIVSTARQKAEAAKLRSSGIDGEKPRDIIVAASEAIAADLAPDGFSFSKSALKLKRIQGDLTFWIWFQSDMNNVVGRRAAIWIHAGVTSARLRRARRSNPMPWGGDDGPDAGAVTGAQIGGLLAKPTWLEWDFAKAETRENEIADAIATIRQVVLPYFDLFDDPANAVDVLIHKPGGSQASSLVHYTLVVLGTAAAETAGRSYLESNPTIRERFTAAFADFTENGLPPCRTDFGGDLAAVAVANGLDLTPP